MIRISPAIRIALSLVMLTSSLVLLGDVLGIVPNEKRAMLDGRKKFCETLALQLSIAASRKDAIMIQSTLNLFVDRDSDVVSAGIRTADDALLVSAGAHEENWVEFDKQKSLSTHVQVPIFNGEKHWATVEVSFVPLSTGKGLLNGSTVGLMLFIGLIGFFIYLVFIKRILRELDPGSVIPERVKSAFNALAEGLIIIDEKEQIILANDSFADKTRKSVDKLVGIKASKLGWEKDNSGEDVKFPWYRSLQSSERKTGIRLKIRARDNVLRTFMVNSAPITDAEGKIRGALVTFDDMTVLDKKHRELKHTLTRLQDSEKSLRHKTVELEYLATRDPLTGCLNRRSFLELYEEAFARAKDVDKDLICVMVDLDHFKSINDRHGHAAGDKVLKVVAELLRTNSRAGDLVGRYGGEEFCIILPNTNLDQGLALVERLRTLIQASAPTQFPSTRVTASFGLAVLSDDASRPEELTNLADSALYVAKDRGRNRVVCWNDVRDEYRHMDGESRILELPIAEKIPKGEPDNLAQVTEAIDARSNIPIVVEKPVEMYDVLTGLPTRTLFCDRIGQIVASGARYDRIAAIVSLEIDTYKRINDALGPAVANQLLIKVSERISKVLRSADTVAALKASDSGDDHTNVSRLNNDEFGILVTDVDDVKSVAWVVKRMFDALSKQINVDGHEIFVTCTAGVSIFPHDADDAETLIAHSSAARNDAKRTFGRNHMGFYSPDINKTAYRQLWLESELYRAVEDGEFLLHYQPQVDLRTEKIRGMEALLRWPHPKLGMVPPSEFIPIAERTDLIDVIGEWVLRTACEQGRLWINQGHLDTRITVNLSAAQFLEPELGDKIATIIEESGLPPHKLELEITETVLMNNLSNAENIIKQLHNLGVTFAIDDFGTGYSSLSLLKDLPVESLKIDRSFLGDSVLNEQEKLIINAIVSMGHNMSLRVIAEGVETDAQRLYLHSLKCDEFQGYLFSKPCLPESATDLLELNRNNLSATG